MHPDDKAQVCNNISRNVSLLSPENLNCSIFKVHAHLRNVNDKAYEPEIIAIGPYHRDRDNVKMMEEHKLFYLQSMLLRGKEGVEKYVSAIGRMEQELRKCYAERIDLDAAAFTEMMVLDGCFIVELVRKCDMMYLRQKDDPIFKRDWMMNSLLRDLLLFENQIPFSVLFTLFDLIEPPNNHSRLISLVLNCFHTVFPGAGCRTSVNTSSNEIKHLLELIHISWLPELKWLDFGKDTEEQRKRWRFINSATELGEANVIFKRTASVSLFDVGFEHGTMLLPPITIEDRTESFFRNLIAYEQYFPGAKLNYVTDYVKFLDCLIDSSGDADILSQRGILDNWLGDSEAVSNMFLRLTDSVTGPGKHFIYQDIFDSVNIHCNKRRNRWMAKLRRNYFNSPWGILSIIVATLLLLLTVCQTVFSILQVV